MSWVSWEEESSETPELKPKAKQEARIKQRDSIYKAIGNTGELIHMSLFIPNCCVVIRELGCQLLKLAILLSEVFSQDLLSQDLLVERYFSRQRHRAN